MSRKKAELLRDWFCLFSALLMISWVVSSGCHTVQAADAWLDPNHPVNVGSSRIYTNESAPPEPVAVSVPNTNTYRITLAWDWVVVAGDPVDHFEVQLVPTNGTSRVMMVPANQTTNQIWYLSTTNRYSMSVTAVLASGYTARSTNFWWRPDGASNGPPIITILASPDLTVWTNVPGCLPITAPAAPHLFYMVQIATPVGTNDWSGYETPMIAQ